MIETTTADEATKLLSDFAGDCYEIVAKFKPAGNGKVGFDVCVGGSQKTSIIYDPTAKTMSIDRSQSSKMVSDAPAFVSIYKQENVTLNAGGTMDIHIYMVAVDAVCWAVGSGLLSGKSGGRLDPIGRATRAEVAQILMNFNQNIVK